MKRRRVFRALKKLLETEGVSIGPTEAIYRENGACAGRYSFGDKHVECCILLLKKGLMDMNESFFKSAWSPDHQFTWQMLDLRTSRFRGLESLRGAKRNECDVNLATKEIEITRRLSYKYMELRDNKIVCHLIKQ